MSALDPMEIARALTLDDAWAAQLRVRSNEWASLLDRRS